MCVFSWYILLIDTFWYQVQFFQGTIRTGTELPVHLANLFSKKSLLEIGMANKQSEAYMKKFDKMIENKKKVM